MGSIKGTDFMAAKRPELPIAHIYAPRFPHEPIEIIGNKPGLERLVNVLIDALTEQRANARVFTSDRHDSEVRAVCLHGERRREEWSRSGSPRWDVDDPLIARILDLSEANDRLRRVISALRHHRKSVAQVDAPGETEATDDGAPARD
jgi:hypothetical protein